MRPWALTQHPSMQQMKRLYSPSMQPNSKHWNILPPITPEADSALSGLNPPILRQVRSFLRGEPNINTDPFQMTGMNESVERIRYAIQNNEPIAIYGDYDVDGVTATALLVETLKKIGGDVRGYIPNRFDEGYGLNNNALEADDTFKSPF